MPLSPGARLGPYEIVAPIGAGGMGEVYRARDTKLDREVAVKVLPEKVAADADTLARFEREAKAVAALSHPNILSIFDFATHGGVSYAVMKLLEGETLRGKLAAGPVPHRQAVDYALQIARGLSAAHERGVVHRDLKPENVFVTKDGHVKILDFGLARRIEPVPVGQETSAPTDSAYTTPGTVMGTVGYMSPEQVRLLVDHRSDIFSFGAILYELLTGKRAFQKATPADTMSAILKEEPAELSESRSTISPALDRVVRHCLEKAKESRFQSARDIAFALEDGSSPVVTGPADGAAPAAARSRALIAAVLITGLAVAGFFLLRRRHEGASQAARVKRMVVLPFENLGSAEDDYFADGIADAVRGKLTSVPGIEVIARGSSISYKKTTKRPKQIADELDARYLLTATVRWQKSGGTSRVQVSPELVEVKDSGVPASKWQQPFDAALTDVFQVQSDIATRVAQALGVALGTGDENRLSEKPTQNLAAYDAFLRGENAEHSLTGFSSTPKANAFYERAVALDPGFSLAWARLSLASTGVYWASTPTPELAERARQAAEKAVALRPDNAEAYLALALYQDYVLNDMAHAAEQYARAIRLGPKNAVLLEFKALVESRLGHWDAQLENLKQAQQLDPRSAGRAVALGKALVGLRRYGEAREVFDRGLVLAPTGLELIQGKAVTFLAEGDLDRARGVIRAVPTEIDPSALVAYLANDRDLVWILDETQMELLLRLMPGAFDDDRAAWALCLAQGYALRGDSANLHIYAEKARTAFEEQLRTAPLNAPRHALLGVALAYLGRKEQAIREGERAVALRPVEKDPYYGAYDQHQLVRIYTLVGDPEKALDHLEALLKVPNVLSPGWLKVDPNFDPLRKNPRFQKLVAGA